jgi:hypothetical protein
MDFLVDQAVVAVEMLVQVVQELLAKEIQAETVPAPAEQIT